MSVVINEDKANIESIMQLVGGATGTGGVIATLGTIKSDIETSTSTSKSKLEAFTVTTLDDPVVLAFKNAASSGGEIYTKYENIEKSLDSGSYVALQDLLTTFYARLNTLKTKIEDNNAANEHNNSVNSTIGVRSKDWNKLNEYNSEHNTNLSYRSTVDLSSYKTNCQTCLTAIQGITFSFNEEDGAPRELDFVTETATGARNPDCTFNVDYLNENKVTADEAAQNAEMYKSTGEYPEVIYIADGQYIRYDFEGWGKFDYKPGDGGMFLVLDRNSGRYQPVSANGREVRVSADWVGNIRGASIPASDLFNHVTTKRGRGMSEGDSRWVLG